MEERQSLLCVNQIYSDCCHSAFGYKRNKVNLSRVSIIKWISMYLFQSFCQLILCLYIYFNMHRNIVYLFINFGYNIPVNIII